MTEQRVTEAAPERTSPSFCAGCGEPVRGAFCGACGQPVAEADAPIAGPFSGLVAGAVAGFTPPTAPPPPRRSHTGVVLGVGAAVLAVAGAAAAAFFLLGRPGSRTTTVTAAAAAVTSTPRVTPVHPSGVAADAVRRTHHASTVTRTVTAGSAAAAPATTADGPTASGASATGASAQAAAEAVQQEWSDINDGDYAAAYGLLAPSLATGESAFVSSHQQTAPIHATVQTGTPTLTSSDTATVPLESLQTNDSTGCNNWTGSYGMQESGGQWLISSADISKSPC